MKFHEIILLPFGDKKSPPDSGREHRREGQTPGRDTGIAWNVADLAKKASNFTQTFGNETNFVTKCT